MSEDELPSAKKEPKESRKRKPDETRDGYDPGSPTSESESSTKKQAVAKVTCDIYFFYVVFKEYNAITIDGLLYLVVPIM